MCCWDGTTWDARVIMVCRRPRLVILVAAIRISFLLWIWLSVWVVFASDLIMQCFLPIELRRSHDERTLCASM